jgi:hypothetical protein
MDRRDPVEPLKGLYLEAAHKDVSNLERLIHDVIEDPAHWVAARRDMRRVTHDVMGQGAAFGYPLMTRVGQSLSHLLKVREDLDDAVLELAHNHISALRSALERRTDDTQAGTGNTLAAGLEARVAILVDE